MFGSPLELMMKGTVYKWRNKLWVYTADGPGTTFHAVEYGVQMPAPVYLIPSEGPVPAKEDELKEIRGETSAIAKH